ncbi:MAG: hypothetical protein A2Z99_11365 [Treponema sp. GWB1_62_6]|nr:MAG: hypothetical protein A2Y36_11060 [Treponema sp. GWA1_62_8]OHE66947.1 MAG: hypothetical protein A2001_07810 [Treponema sp. GWC1_61_84]OHE67990.1 MAG: hypothetical protein A2413_14280 [Treponema sp. RIFOXYC1_FULL_61_9]OHE70101.1 MAG: hypothetical protein A2Z99_11365 [Treponema sp. GWB1_62_6]HCM25504.1 hypothetical protein [Treponema sp.]
MRYAIPAIFIAVGLGCIWLVLGPSPFGSQRGGVQPQARVVSPQAHGLEDEGAESVNAERMAYEDAAIAKVALKDGEVAISVLTQDFDGDPQDEQVIAYCQSSQSDSPVNIAYADFDEATGGWVRVWDAPTAATRSRTVSVFAKDLLGDRSICVVAAGMNGLGEQTLTVFRKSQVPDREPFERIAELSTDGSVAILESDRSQAYLLGIATGTGFRIATYGRDFESSNILDQIETTYAWDPATGRYERIGAARLPGTQIEQRRVRELLDGSPDKFERFLDGLWYFVGASGTGEEKQYVFFDTQRRELVFYADDTQEVFAWQNSNSTRYGLYLATQNISVVTLRRLIDIELESADSIRMKVFEDVKLKIGVGGRWDGTYRKTAAAAVQDKGNPGEGAGARLDATYESPSGNIYFTKDGNFSLQLAGAKTEGSYAFFRIGPLELLELRAKGEKTVQRATYRVARSGNPSGGEGLTLSRVRLGVGGVEESMERDLIFTRSSIR